MPVNWLVAPNHSPVDQHPQTTFVDHAGECRILRNLLDARPVALGGTITPPPAVTGSRQSAPTSICTFGAGQLSSIWLAAHSP